MFCGGANFTINAANARTNLTGSTDSFSLRTNEIPQINFVSPVCFAILRALAGMPSRNRKYHFIV